MRSGEMADWTASAHPCLIRRAHRLGSRHGHISAPQGNKYPLRRSARARPSVTRSRRPNYEGATAWPAGPGRRGEAAARGVWDESPGTVTVTTRREAAGGAPWRSSVRPSRFPHSFPNTTTAPLADRPEKRSPAASRRSEGFHSARSLRPGRGNRPFAA